VQQRGDHPLPFGQEGDLLGVNYFLFLIACVLFWQNIMGRSNAHGNEKDKCKCACHNPAGGASCAGGCCSPCKKCGLNIADDLHSGHEERCNPGGAPIQMRWSYGKFNPSPIALVQPTRSSSINKNTLMCSSRPDFLFHGQFLLEFYMKRNRGSNPHSSSSRRVDGRKAREEECTN